MLAFETLNRVREALMPFAGRQRHYGYKPPTLAERRARAVVFLLNVRSLDGLTVEGLAHRYSLKPPVAELLLSQERARRG